MKYFIFSKNTRNFQKLFTVTEKVGYLRFFHIYFETKTDKNRYIDSDWNYSSF